MTEPRDGYLPQVVQQHTHRCAACGKPWPDPLSALYCERTVDADDG